VVHEGETQRNKLETWQAVERGERLTKRKACELFPSLSELRLRALPSVVAWQPTIGINSARDVHTYLLSDVEAFAAKAAAELTDPTWQAVERGERLTRQKVFELYPSVSRKRLVALNFVVARQPTIGDVNTYQRSEVEALAAQVAAESADPAVWQAVERGERLTLSKACELYPSLSESRLRALPSVVARQPTIGTCSARDVNTYLRTDVEAVAAEIEASDPAWQAVERGERLTSSKARELYPCLSEQRLRKTLHSVVARQPWIGKKCACNVNTYLRTDVETLAAEVAGDNVPPAPKRPRVEKAARPRVEKAPPRGDACPVCLEDLGDGATALDCGHRIHSSCLEELKSNAWADGSAATRTRRGTRLTCPCCRAPSLVEDPGFRVGDEVEAKWCGTWFPGSIDEVLSEEGSYEVLWDTGEVNPIPARDVRARAA
jgi:hypothetical protein